MGCRRADSAKAGGGGGARVPAVKLEPVGGAGGGGLVGPVAEVRARPAQASAVQTAARSLP